MAQTALRAQVMLRTATPRFPPQRCHAAVERTAHATPYAPQAGVRRPIFLSAEVSASLQQQNMIRLLASASRKRVAEFSMLACCIFASNLSLRLPSRALTTLSTGLLETEILAPVMRLRSRARDQPDHPSSRFCVRFRWVRRACNEKFS
jgi:hypothetical protein